MKRLVSLLLLVIMLLNTSTVVFAENIQEPFTAQEEIDSAMLEIEEFMNSKCSIIGFNQTKTFHIPLSNGEIITVMVEEKSLESSYMPDTTRYYPGVLGNRVFTYTIDFPGKGEIKHKIYYTVTHVPSLDNDEHDIVLFDVTDDSISAVPVFGTAIVDKNTDLTTGFCYGRSEAYVTFDVSHVGYWNIYSTIEIMPAGNYGDYRNKLAISYDYDTM